MIVPFIHIMDHPVPFNQVTVGFVDDPQIKADNAGAGQFFVTTRPAVGRPLRPRWLAPSPGCAPHKPRHVVGTNEKVEVECA